jgi:hypothetical protein
MGTKVFHQSMVWAPNNQRSLRAGAEQKLQHRESQQAGGSKQLDGVHHDWDLSTLRSTDHACSSVPMASRMWRTTNTQGDEVVLPLV